MELPIENSSSQNALIALESISRIPIISDFVDFFRPSVEFNVDFLLHQDGFRWISGNPKKNSSFCANISYRAIRNRRGNKMLFVLLLVLFLILYKHEQLPHVPNLHVQQMQKKIYLIKLYFFFEQKRQNYKVTLQFR